MISEHPSVLTMWKEYLNSIGEAIFNTKKKYLSWHFELTENGANNLVNLVLEGKKRATASSCWSYEYDQQPVPREGDYSIITDWDGVAKCIIRTTKA